MLPDHCAENIIVKPNKILPVAALMLQSLGGLAEPFGDILGVWAVEPTCMPRFCTPYSWRTSKLRDTASPKDARDKNETNFTGIPSDKDLVGDQGQKS